MSPAEELRYLILAAQREGNRRLTESLRPLGVTPSQAEVLRILQHHAPLPLIGLGELLICETGSPSRLVGGLVEAGLVERTPSARDKRMITLRLSVEGRAVAAQVAAIEARLHESITATLSEERIAELLPELRMLIAETASSRAMKKRADNTRGTRSGVGPPPTGVDEIGGQGEQAEA